MNKKYKLLPKQLVRFNGVTVNGKTVEQKMYRIKALRDIPSHNVKAGDLGGWVNRRNILSHEGDCWIGGDAKVFVQYNASNSSKVAGNALVTDNAILYGIGDTAIEISEDAIVEDTSKIFAAVYGIVSRIRGDARVSQNATVKNAEVITGKVSGDALVVESSNVTGDAHVSGKAKVYNSTISDSAMVMGNAVVSNKAIISESSVVTDDAIVSGAQVRGASKVLGNANVKEKSLICENAVVTDRALICKDAVIAGESIIKDDAVVSEGAHVLGKSVISKYRIIGVYEKLTDFISTEDRAAISASPSMKELTETASPLESETSGIQDFCLRLEGLKKEISAYGNDIVKLLKFPIMSDLRDENTLDMMLALKNSSRIDPARSPKKFRKSVDLLERKFMKAESNALLISATAFSDDQRKKADKARDLFAIACNDVSSEQEKRSAFKQGFRQLEGVVVITDSAVENMRIKVGIPELEA